MIILVDTVLQQYVPELDRWVITDKDTWPWKYDNGKLYLQSTGLLLDAPTLDDVFTKIKGYYYGTNYQIVDIRQGV